MLPLVLLWRTNQCNQAITCHCTFSHFTLTLTNFCNGSRLNTVSPFGPMVTSQLILLNQLSNWVCDLSLSVSKRIGHLALTSGDVGWLTMLQLCSKWNPNTTLRCAMRPGRWQRISQREWPRDCLHLRLRPSHQRLPDDVLSSKKAMFLPRYAAGKSLYCAKSVVLINHCPSHWLFTRKCPWVLPLSLVSNSYCNQTHIIPPPVIFCHYLAALRSLSITYLLQLLISNSIHLLHSSTRTHWYKFR